MADVSKIKVPDGTSYDIVAKTARGLVRATMNDTSSTSTAFVVTAPGITELYDGLTMTCKNTKVASAANCTLNLNDLGAKRIWLSQGNSYCTTHWALNTTYIFIYDATNERWELQQGRDTDANDTYTVRPSYTHVYAGANGLKQYSLFARTKDGRYTSFTTNSGTGAKTFDTTTEFDLNKILYYNASSNLGAGSLTGNNTFTMSVNLLDMRYSFTGVTTSASTSTLQSNKPVYLVATPTDDGYFTITSPYYTQAPTSSSTVVYILVGYMYDSYRMDLHIFNPIYRYDGTNFIPFLDAKTVNGHTIDSDVPANAVFTDTKSDWNATSGNAQILNKPTLGTASSKDVAASGNASTTQVVMGNDTRLSDSRTPTSHSHGNIQNGGALQTTDVTIANGDKLVVTDASDSSKVARSSIAFDGSTTTQCLTKKGTWASFTNNAGTVTSVKVGSTSYSPSSGVVSLPAYPSVPITGVQLNGQTLTPTSGVVNVNTGIARDEYGPSTSERILARSNIFVPTWTKNPERMTLHDQYFYNGLTPVRIGDVDELIRDIPSGITWSNFAYFRIMNMSVLQATVTWTSTAHATSLTLGYIRDNHISPDSNYQYTDWPLKAVTMLAQRDNGSGANRDTARLVISDSTGAITVAVNGSAPTAYANFARVQFSISYVNRQAYGPNDNEWYNEPPD